MKWIWLSLFLILIGLSGAALAQEYGAVPFGSTSGDPWTDSVQPSGLRFTEPNTTTRTGAYGGGGGMGTCDTCGWGAGTCVHWTLIPWYAPWPTAHDLNKGHRRACCANAEY